MYVLDVSKYLETQNEKIEEELQKKYPGVKDIPFTVAMATEPALELYFIARCAGVEFVMDDNGSIIIDNKVQFRVPSKSELYFSNSTNGKQYKLHELSGVNIAKLVKIEILHILDSICNRTNDEKHSDIKFMYKEHNKEITSDVFKTITKNGLKSVRLHSKNMQIFADAGDENRDYIFTFMHELASLAWYGISVKVEGLDIEAPNEEIDERLKEMRKNKSATIVVTVPEHSEFSTDGTSKGEIAGESAYDMIMQTFDRVGLTDPIKKKGIKVKYGIRKGEKWTKDMQKEAMDGLNEIENSYRKVFQ